MPRVPQIAPEELPDEYEILDDQSEDLHKDITAEWWNALATVQTFGNNIELAKTHVYTNVSMWTKSGLTPQEVEIVILAVGRALDSEYEWHAHVIAAIERAEMNPETILGISRKDLSSLSESEKALVEYAFEYVDENGNISDETHSNLAEYYDDSTLVGIAMLAAYYIFIQLVANALQLELEEEFVGWELENY